MTYACKIVRDSVNVRGNRLTSFEVTYPRFILAEVNTHRMVSKSTASSRAIPVAKMLEAVRTNPFIPIYWGANQAGMQAQAELPADKASACKTNWLIARDMVVNQVEAMVAHGLHKQIANRALEPWMWTTSILTATNWSNLFGQRCHPAAQPEFQKLAVMMRDAMAASQPELLATGHWHLPYTPDIEALRAEHTFNPEAVARISAARCARVSYTNQGVVKTSADDLALAESLAESGHMSPFEHVAVASPTAGYSGNLNGWVQLRKFMPYEDDFSKRPRP